MKLSEKGFSFTYLICRVLLSSAGVVLSAPLLLNEHVIVLARQDGKHRALTATNNAATPQTVTVQVPTGWDETQWLDALTGERLMQVQGRVTLTVPALFGTVLLAR